MMGALGAQSIALDAQAMTPPEPVSTGFEAAFFMSFLTAKGADR